MNGLSPKAMRFLAVLVVLIFLFIIEPIPLEITAILIGVLLVCTGVADVKTAWAPYMHPVVIFIMCCLIFAISLEKAGLTKRLGYFIVKRAGNSVVKFTFIISIGLGIASSFMHDAAACAIGIVTMLPPHAGGGDRAPHQYGEIHAAVAPLRVLMRRHGLSHRRRKMHGLGGVPARIYGYRDHFF